MNRILDRVQRFDAKSRNYQVRSLLDLAPKKRKRPVGRTTVSPTLDQGAEGACVGFGYTHVNNAKPLAAWVLTDVGPLESYARIAYKGAQQHDQWAGESYEGSSVLGAAQWAKQVGNVSSYWWIGAGSGTALDDLRETVWYYAPVHLGTVWVPSMFEPTRTGELVVERVADPDAGHSYACIDYVKRKGLWWAVIQNSWGARWGVAHKGVYGCAYIREDAMGWLLEQGGEGAVYLR